MLILFRDWWLIFSKKKKKEKNELQIFQVKTLRQEIQIANMNMTNASLAGKSVQR